jgi:predicted alpha/beta-fold hydrolase
VILKDIQENNSLLSKKIILTGISLGGITILDYLNEKENIEGISRVVVIGLVGIMLILETYFTKIMIY